MYGQSRGFAAISALRLIGNVWTLVLASGLILWAGQDERRARDLLLSLNPSMRFDARDAETIWTISEANAGIRQALLESIFESRSSRLIFARGSDWLLYATIGFDEEFANRYLVEAFRENCEGKNLKLQEYRQVCLSLWSALPPVWTCARVSRGVNRLEQESTTAKPPR